jgi:hypothetical protein
MAAAEGKVCHIPHLCGGHAACEQRQHHQSRYIPLHTCNVCASPMSHTLDALLVAINCLGRRVRPIDPGVRLLVVVHHSSAPFNCIQYSPQIYSSQPRRCPHWRAKGAHCRLALPSASAWRRHMHMPDTANPTHYLCHESGICVQMGLRLTFVCMRPSRTKRCTVTHAAAGISSQARTKNNRRLVDQAVTGQPAMTPSCSRRS